MFSWLNTERHSSVNSYLKDQRKPPSDYNLIKTMAALN